MGRIDSALLATLVVSALTLGLVAAHAQEAAVKIKNGFLTSANGMTLYFYDRDPVDAGTSVCNAKCAETWLPLAAGADAAPSLDLGIISREDGTRQWAYRGRPLYLFANDPGPGDKTGDGTDQMWHAAKQ